MELHIRCLPQSKHPTSESESGSVVSDCDPMDDTVHGILQARILEWVAFPLLQGIFPTPELNRGLLHCRQILYQLRLTKPH